MNKRPLISANYHTHTVRCNHAAGSEREYVQQAIAAGLKVLGFADHSPYIFQGDYYSSFRMRPQELSSYVSVLQALKKEYEGEIEIHIGLEAEYYPDVFEDYKELIRDSGVEYLILGQHYAGKEPSKRYSGRADDDEERLHLYVDSVLEGARSGFYSYIAHPDILNFTGDYRLFISEMDRLVEGIVKEDLPLEMNILGLREGRHYPREDFLALVSKHGGKMIVGCDAHRPQDVYDEPTVKRALELLEKYGIERTEQVDIRRLEKLL